MVFGLKFDFQISANWKPAILVAALIDFPAGFIGKPVSFSLVVAVVLTRNCEIWKTKTG
jgi:hypothetical protein